MSALARAVGQAIRAGATLVVARIRLERVRRAERRA